MPEQAGGSSSSTSSSPPSPAHQPQDCRFVSESLLRTYRVCEEEIEIADNLLSELDRKALEPLPDLDFSPLCSSCGSRLSDGLLSDSSSLEDLRNGAFLGDIFSRRSEVEPAEDACSVKSGESKRSQPFARPLALALGRRFGSQDGAEGRHATAGGSEEGDLGEALLVEVGDGAADTVNANDVVDEKPSRILSAEATSGTPKSSELAEKIASEHKRPPERSRSLLEVFFGTTTDGGGGEKQSEKEIHPPHPHAPPSPSDSHPGSSEPLLQEEVLSQPASADARSGLVSTPSDTRELAFMGDSKDSATVLRWDF